MIVPEKGITSRGLKITSMSLFVMGLFPLSIWLPLMSQVSTARTGASSLRLCVHVSAHIFSFCSGLSLYQSITFCCSSIVLFGNKMPLDWFVVREPLMLVPQHRASRARHWSSVCQVPKSKSHFLGFSKHFTASHSQKFCTVSDAPELAFPRVKHAGRSQTLQGRKEQNLLFGALGSLHEVCSDISCHVLLLCCSGLRTVSPPSFSFFWFGCLHCHQEGLRLCSFFISLGHSFWERNLSYDGRGKDTHCLIQDEKLLLIWLRISHIPGTGFCIRLKIHVKGTSIVLAGLDIQCIFQRWNSEVQRRSV